MVVSERRGEGGREVEGQTDTADGEVPQRATGGVEEKGDWNQTLSWSSRNQLRPQSNHRSSLKMLGMKGK